MTENKCLCGTNDIRKFKTFGKRDLYQCNKCGSLSILPYPFVSELSAFDFYQKENYLEKINEDEYFGYFKVIESEIESLKINLNSKILDYGCGYGFLVKFLRLAGYKNSFGFEINKNLVKKAFDRFDHNFIFSEEVELQSQKFDLVIMNMVLEHVLNPYHYVNNIVFDILNKNGVLIITVPNMNSLNRFLLGKKWMGYSPEEHIYFLNPSRLDILINAEKYFVKKIVVKSAINTKYDAWHPKGILKFIVKNTIMRFSELIGRGDQLILILTKKDSHD